MALATTCPQCKTSFKVIPDQLKLRRGLVRCGVCQHVFSGIDYLRYVDDSGKARQKAASGQAVSTGTPGSARSRQADGARASSSRESPPAAGSDRPAARIDAGAASPHTVIAADDELKTAFFLSDSTFGPYSQTRPQDVVPPRSIVARDQRAPTQAPVDPRAASDPAAQSLRESKPRQPADRDPTVGPPTRLASRSRTATAADSAGGSRRHRSRSSLLGPAEDEDPEVAAANQLARQAKEAFRGAPAGKRTSRSHSLRWPDFGEGHAPFEDLGVYFADPRRRYAVIGLVVLALLQLS
ncbi:MAG: MJ0042-type zinc finger domain-containing protein, partial [Lautropia sp.]